MGSGKRIWWQCQNNSKHSYENTIKRRVGEGANCSICYQESLHSLDKYPNALKFFDYKRNRGLKPERVCLGSVVWWKCPEAIDHVWKGRFKEIMRCRFCNNRKASSTSSLHALYPKLAQQVHPTRNGKLTADKIAAHGEDYIWWRCAYDPLHIWQAKVYNRTRNGSNCPDCWKLRRPKYFKRLAAERKLAASADAKD